MGLISNGTTIFDAGSLTAGLGGSMTFIKKLTASTSSTLSFVDGASSVVLDNTYNEYLFTFNNLHPSENAHANFLMNFSADSGSNYNVSKQTTLFRTYHQEDGTSSSLLYQNEFDLANSTSFQNLYAYGAGDDADMCWGGYMMLFQPSSTTFVKHYSSNISGTDGNYEHNHFSGGYANTTSAIDAVQFKMSAGTIDAGDICLYGIG
tara:strand:+ start:151 stop:768 length:618 start_codon:yes stop_codon:yes gene_type:complete